MKYSDTRKTITSQKMAQTSNPPEWKDEETMSVLFSPFRESRNVNPSSWDRKMNFWSKLIKQRYLLEGKVYFTAKDLPRQFERKGRFPFCLGVVVDEMEKQGQLQKLNDFCASGPSTWRGWTFRTFVKKPVQLSYTWLLKKPLGWSYRWLVGGRSAESTPGLATADCTRGLPETDFVIMDVLQCVAEQVLDGHYSSMKNSATDNVRGLEDFRLKCQHCCPDRLTFDLAVLWLCKQKKCFVQDTGQEKLIVFASLGQSVKPELSDTDLRVYRLKNAEDKLSEQVLMLGDEIEKLRREAKTFLQKGMKSSAKNCLKKKKRLEDQQNKKELAIDNIQHLLVTIQQAYSDKQVIDAYSSGVEAFKDISNKYGLTPDMVDDVMIGVQEVLETQDELNRSISSPIRPDEPYLGDLEDELRDILDTEEELPKVPVGEPQSPHQDLIDSVCQMKLTEDDLPDVPAHSPGCSPVGFPPLTPPRARPTSPSRVAMLDLGFASPTLKTDMQHTWKSPVKPTAAATGSQGSNFPGYGRDSNFRRLSPEKPSQGNSQSFFQPWTSGSPDRSGQFVDLPSVPSTDPVNTSFRDYYTTDPDTKPGNSRGWYTTDPDTRPSNSMAWTNPDPHCGVKGQNKGAERRELQNEWLPG